MTTESETLDLRRRWLAITLGTVVMQFAYWPVVGSLGLRESGELGGVAVELALFGAAIIPFAFLTLAAVSRHPDVGMATLKALGLCLLIGPGLIAVAGPFVGTVAGLSAGGVAALRRDEVHSLRWRWIAVASTLVYIVVLGMFSVEFALMSGAVLPFTVHGLVDQAAETR